MKILLVYPQYPDTFGSFKYALKLVSKKAIYPPLGLLTVAAMLPGEWEKKLIDMNVTALRDTDILWADYIFISAMDVQKDFAQDTITRCKKLGAKIVAGGPLFTSRYEEFDEVDHFVLGEAEVTLSPFLVDLAKGCAEPIYLTNERPDIDNTPLPLWPLLDMDNYASMNIQYSRGCPFDCEFCDIVFLYGRVPRTKSCLQMVSELDILYNLGWRGQVLLVDDNFIGNKKKLKAEILPTIIEWSKKNNYPFAFLTQSSINLAEDEELMKLMTEAGFTRVFVGIESPNEESLAECDKFMNKGRDLVDMVKKIQNYGLEVQGGFIVGFDSDPPSIFNSQIDFIQKSGIVTAMVSLLGALHGTKLYQRLKSENRLLNETTGDNTDCTMNFVPKMDLELLIKGYKQVLDNIYSPIPYYQRIHTFYKEYQPQIKQSSKIQFLHIIWLIKSLWYLGVAEDGRWYFWKLLITTLIRYPRFFMLSIRFSIYRLHFYKLTRRLFEVETNMQVVQLSAKLKEKVHA
jgi:radical SAM superfamily enzyme YgiQ (UPF0313 family)